jgi:hypothetical protein
VDQVGHVLLLVHDQGLDVSEVAGARRCAHLEKTDLDLLDFFGKSGGLDEVVKLVYRVIRKNFSEEEYGFPLSAWSIDG